MSELCTCYKPTVYVLDNFYTKFTNFQAGLIEKKGKPTNKYEKKRGIIPNANVLTAVAYAHENTIIANMRGERAREKRRTNKNGTRPFSVHL